MKPIPYRSMTVAGLMSGTSADGIDVSVVRITPRNGSLRIHLLGHAAFPFPRSLRQAVLAAMDSRRTTTAELARLHWRLGLAYAEAVEETRRIIPARLDLVGCHGQTIYHQPKAQRYLGRSIACTWQLGEMAPVAASAGAPIVSNFRPADMAAGGQGAPLVPLLDFLMYRHPRRGRVLQNLGGIGNLTAMTPNAKLSQVLAFDTGPANMVIDQLVWRLFQRKFDRDGAIARSGRVLAPIVAATLRSRFFAQPPPKSTGREQFGAGFAMEFLRRCRRAGGGDADAVATATALTARSILLAYSSFVRERMAQAPVDFLISGGGARNRTLVAMVRAGLTPLGCRVETSDHMGMPAEAKEAAAFALLAYQTWHGRPGNVPAATGASRTMVLGQIQMPDPAWEKRRQSVKSRG